ncbi:unnamed protein product [Peronospora belbahrii]|uniref:Mediator complex subunit 15 KIX domain-containing protein n=1 Tax=Peronospora belbahrii TaxID=622444 RepID=A0ABN8CRN4_9STRA|nr:unnamed protein product [Peronospora belbahrii]
MYLQRIYRQLQSTHPHQEDIMIRQVATNIEMKICQKSVRRSEYIAAMDQEIHQLMQIELAQANASIYTNDGQSFENLQNSKTQAQQLAVSSEMSSTYLPHEISQSRSFEYAQALAKAQAQETNSVSAAFTTPRYSDIGDNSFQSLMKNQTQGYGLNGVQQQQHQTTPNRSISMQSFPQRGNQFYSTTSKMPSNSQNILMHGHVGNISGQGVTRNMMEAQQKLNGFQMQSQYKQQARPTRPQQRVSTFQAFSAQIQHLDKSVLIELLWNQRSALAQWQRQAKQLEYQLSAQQSNANSMENPVFHPVYNSPKVGGSKLVCPNVSAEAEMQRARERNNARNVMSQYSYTQHSNEGSPACSQATDNEVTWEENVQAYWDKVQSLKTTYTDHLHIAKRALENNSAPPNTLYSVKAQSVMNNIGLVLDILDEQPTNVQPRKLNILNSIERFLQITVVPIVRKVQSSFTTSAPQTQVTLASTPAATATVATISSEMSSPQGGDPGRTGQRTEDYYAASEWSSNTISDMSRQSSRETFTDSAEVKSSSGRMIDDGTDTPSKMMDELSPPVQNSPTNSGYMPSQYAPVKPKSNDAVTMQTEVPEGRTPDVFEASVTPKEPSTPTSEFHLPTVSETRPPCSPGGVMKDGKMLQSNVDVLNDFADFSELDFDEDSNSFAKENKSSNISMKRGLEDM